MSFERWERLVQERLKGRTPAQAQPPQDTENKETKGAEQHEQEEEIHPERV